MLHNKILMIDDELHVCTGFQRIFEEEGYAAEYALTGSDGVQKAYSHAYDVIITDLKMPDLSGIDVIKNIKKKRPGTPIIMITGYASVTTAVEAMKSGAEDYLSKPFSPGELLSAVDRAMKKAGPAVKPKGKETGKGIIEKDQVMEVLNRASSDKGFWLDLMENGSEALSDYDLSSEAMAAIVSGDIRWIEKNIGQLTDDQLKYLKARLQMERW